MLLEDIMQCVCIIDIQIVIITNFVVVSSVGIKRVDCTIKTIFSFLQNGFIAKSNMLH